MAPSQQTCIVETLAQFFFADKKHAGLSVDRTLHITDTYPKDQRLYRGVSYVGEVKSKLKETGVWDFTESCRAHKKSLKQFYDWTENTYGTRGYVPAMFFGERNLSIFPDPPANCMFSVLC